jgi:probable rRNA maturation factor
MADAGPIDVHIDDSYAGRVSEETVRRVAESAIQRELLSGPDRVSITVTGDDEVRALNVRFRGLDEPTDVLSFGKDGARRGRIPEDGDGFVLPPDEAPSMGELVIAFGQASRQAEQAGRTVEQEVALLTAHGVLHLLGFDHADPGEEAEMFSKTDAILEQALGPGAAAVVPASYRHGSSHGEDG